MTRLGFIGLGVMGAPMAGRLLAAGHDLTVLTRTPARAWDLLERGARWAETPAAVAAESELVITMLPDTGNVKGVGEELARDGLLWVDMSTVSPSAWRAWAGAGCGASMRRSAAGSGARGTERS